MVTVTRLPLVLLLVPLSGCVVYPRFYDTTKKGQAVLDEGKPIQLKAQLLKYCEKTAGESTDVIKERSTTTDKDGRYSLTIRGVVWHWKNFMTLSECTSRIQMFVCREVCKPADDIDINVLGK
jgi:hypothetical protein